MEADRDASFPQPEASSPASDHQSTDDGTSFWTAIIDLDEAKSRSTPPPREGVEQQDGLEWWARLSGTA